jgi:hypothetical protein
MNDAATLIRNSHGVGTCPAQPDAISQGQPIQSTNALSVSEFVRRASHVGPSLDLNYDSSSPPPPEGRI